MTNEEYTILLNLGLSDIAIMIENDQDYYMEIYNTYLQFLEDKDGDIKFWVHEYLTPKEERGYQVFFSYLIGEKEFIKSVGYGVEKDNRTYDWVEFKEI